jgi:hypothetical protein
MPGKLFENGIAGGAPGMFCGGTSWLVCIFCWPSMFCLPFLPLDQVVNSEHMDKMIDGAT